MTAIQDQVILVTGSTDGIGKQTAHDLAAMGATVLLHGRSRERAVSTLQEIYAATGNDDLEYYLADFSSLAEVRRLAAEVQAKHCRLNVLINNAGIGVVLQKLELDRETLFPGVELCSYLKDLMHEIDSFPNGPSLYFFNLPFAHHVHHFVSSDRSSSRVE